MKSTEAEGTSIDEAIDSALRTLGVERDRVAVDILVSPTRGVLGIGGRKAKVRVTVRQPVGFDDAGSESVDSTSESEPVAGRLATNAHAPIAGATVETADPELAQHAQAVLQDILDHMGFTVSVRIATAEEGVSLAIDGDSSGILIGRHGQTLDALEYFLHRVLSRDESFGRIVVDCEGYRVRRRETLEAMAHRLAQQAKTKQRSVTIEALSPRDRRIVHLALQDEPGLTTRSSGEGFYRKLVIIPEGARGGRQSGNGGRVARPNKTG